MENVRVINTIYGKDYYFKMYSRTRLYEIIEKFILIKK